MYLINLTALGDRQDLRLADLIGCGRNDADARVAVHVHEAQRDDPVEPHVGGPVDNMLATVVTSTRLSDRILKGLDDRRMLDIASTIRGLEFILIQRRCSALGIRQRTWLHWFVTTEIVSASAEIGRASCRERV